MKIRITEIIGKVYDLLDENAAILEERVEYGDPGTDLKSLIVLLLPEAASAVLSAVPLSRVDECRHASADVRHGGDGTAVVTLPSDFLRLVYFRMSDWRGGVSVPLASAGEERRLRQFPYMRARRRICPAVAVTERGDIRELEVFSTTPGARVSALDYIAVPKIEGEFIDLPPGLVPDVARRVAEAVSQIIS